MIASASGTPFIVVFFRIQARIYVVINPEVENFIRKDVAGAF